MKNRILLENYLSPGDLERQIEAFVELYKHQRHQESLNNRTSADIYFGRGNYMMIFDPMRQDPRFQATLKEMNFLP